LKKALDKHGLTSVEPARGNTGRLQRIAA